GTTSLGVFSEQEIREGLSAGRFAPTDIGWQEGMATWQPLSQFPEFGGIAASAVPPVQPGAASTSTTVAGRTGLPWEHRQERGFSNAYTEARTMLFPRPAEAFSVMKREGGLGEPLIYALIGGCVGGIVSALFSLAFQSIGLFADKNNSLAAMTGMGIGFGTVIFVTLLIVIVLFFLIGLVHLCLMLFGGANQSFETTFRVFAFTQGSAGPLQIVPLCGGLISFVWALVCNCIGLARAQETDTGRAVLAVFSPLILCCGGGLLIAFMFGAMGAWTASHH